MFESHLTLLKGSQREWRGPGWSWDLWQSYTGHWSYTSSRSARPENSRVSIFQNNLLIFLPWHQNTRPERILENSLKQKKFYSRLFDKNFILYCLFTVHSTHFKSWLQCNASFWFSMLLLCVHIEKPQSTKYKNLTSGTDVVCTGILGSWKPENIYQFNYTKYYISPSTKRFKIFSLNIFPTTTHNHSSWRNVIHPKSSFIWNIHHQGISLLNSFKGFPWHVFFQSPPLLHQSYN